MTAVPWKIFTYNRLTWLDIELRRTLSCALWLGIRPSTSFSQPQRLQSIEIIWNRVPGAVFGQKILLTIFLGRNCSCGEWKRGHDDVPDLPL